MADKTTIFLAGESESERAGGGSSEPFRLLHFFPSKKEATEEVLRDGETDLQCEMNSFLLQNGA